MIIYFNEILVLNGTWNALLSLVTLFVIARWMKELLALIYLLNVFRECSKRFHPTVNRSYESGPELYSQGCFGQDPIGPLDFATWRRECGLPSSCILHRIGGKMYTRFCLLPAPKTAFSRPKHTSKKLTALENNESWARTPNINVRDPFWSLFYPRFHP